jgi:hypothetical protein
MRGMGREDSEMGTVHIGQQNVCQADDIIVDD